ncbi:MAG: hypothetical protein M3R38_16560 [Actinomycetota bacterium]|nr:hypothetical protein [Actinomycetota bacterium]
MSPRLRDRMAGETTPARAREARARRTRVQIQDEIKRLSQEEYAERQARDLERAKEMVIGPRNDLAVHLAPSQVAPDSLLGAPAPCLACVTMTVTA